MDIIIFIIVMIVGLIPCGTYFLVKLETKNDAITRRFQKYAMRSILVDIIVLVLFIVLEDMRTRLIILLVLLHIINTIFFRKNK